MSNSGIRSGIFCNIGCGSKTVTRSSGFTIQLSRGLVFLAIFGTIFYTIKQSLR